MPRPRKTDRPVEWSISIPSSLAAQVELFLLDPVHGTYRRGARAALITALLKQWLAEASSRPQQKPDTTTTGDKK